MINTELIKPEQLTHINYAFINIKNGKVFLDNEKTDTVNFSKLNQLKLVNPRLKILVSIGGWSWSENFSDAVLSDSARMVFAGSAVDLIRKYRLDGIDIDWEYPGLQGEQGNIFRPQDRQNYTLMFRTLKEELLKLEKQTGETKLLTTAVGGFNAFLEHTEMDKVQHYLDYINIMTYDFYSDAAAEHHTNLLSSKKYEGHNSADKAVKAYIRAGVPADKLVMGIAFYGRTVKTATGKSKGLGAKLISQKYGKGYSFIKDSLVNKNHYKEYRDRPARAAYIFNKQTHEFMTYDNEWSVKNKCRYVLKNGMAGVMFWEYDADQKGYLLNEINKQFVNGE